MTETMETYSYRDLSKKLAERDRQLAQAEKDLNELRLLLKEGAEHVDFLCADLAQAESERDAARALIAQLRQAQYEFTHKLERDCKEWRDQSTELEAKEGK